MAPIKGVSTYFKITSKPVSYSLKMQIKGLKIQVTAGVPSISVWFIPHEVKLQPRIATTSHNLHALLLIQPAGYLSSFPFNTEDQIALPNPLPLQWLTKSSALPAVSGSDLQPFLMIENVHPKSLCNQKRKVRKVMPQGDVHRSLYPETNSDLFKSSLLVS